MHTANQGMCAHLLRSTAWSIADFIDCAAADQDDRFKAAWVKKAQVAWTENMKMLTDMRDLSGLHFNKHLCKLPGTIFAEVTHGKKRMSKLKAFEYKEVALVCNMTLILIYF